MNFYYGAKKIFRCIIINMKITNNNTQPIFKSGLTYKLYKDFKHINVKEVESDFSKINIDAKFLNNKFIAGASVLTANILNDVSSKYKLPFDFLPPAIRSYKEDNIVSGDADDSEGFCIVDTKRVLKDEPSFIGTSIFFNDKNKSVLKENFVSTVVGLLNYNSSGHFLHTILHEWFHCIHQNLVLKKHGYEGNCPVLKERYFKPNACGLRILEKRDVMRGVRLCYQSEVAKLISDYAAENCFKSEIFAELMSMVTVKSLDSHLNPIKNPLDNIPKKLPVLIKQKVEELLEV